MKTKTGNAGVQAMDFHRKEPPAPRWNPQALLVKMQQCVALEHNLTASRKVTPHQNTTSHGDPLSLFTHALREPPHPRKIKCIVFYQPGSLSEEHATTRLLCLGCLWRLYFYKLNLEIPLFLSADKWETNYQNPHKGLPLSYQRSDLRDESHNPTK